MKACVDEVLPTFPGEEPFTGSDEHDYHVHAAAVASRADIILTQNDPADISDCPDNEPYEIYTADDFFLLVVQSNPLCLTPCAHRQFAYWSNRGGGQLDDKLVRADCPQFAARVKEALKSIALGQ